MHVVASGNCETSAYGKLSMANRGGAEKGTAKADAATRRMNEYRDRAVAKGTKRTNTSQEEGHQQHERCTNFEFKWQWRRSTNAELEQQHNEDECHEGGEGCKETNKKRKAEEEHPEDSERDDGKWMRADGKKRKAGEESEKGRLRKTARYLKELDKIENKKGSRKSLEVVEVAEVGVNVEEEEWMTHERITAGRRRERFGPRTSSSRSRR